MKFIILLFFLSFSLFCKTNDSELQKPNPDTGEDYVVIYEYFVGKDPLNQLNGFDRSKQFLNKTLYLYDNIELNGNPKYVISPQSIKHDSEIYNFKESFYGKCQPDCDGYKLIPIDFVRVHWNKVSLAVKDYRNSIARVEHGGKSYFFKFNLKDTQEYFWKDYKSKKHINEILKLDSNYVAFIGELKKCIVKKDLKCLEAFLDGDKINIDQVVLEAKKRGVYDDRSLFDQFEELRKLKELGINDVPEELLSKVKNVDILWVKFSSIINNESDDKFCYLKIGDFGETALYESQVRMKNSYSGSWLDVGMTLVKEKNKWKIVSFSLSAFRY